jgi:hypothetical protein
MHLPKGKVPRWWLAWHFLQVVSFTQVLTRFSTTDILHRVFQRVGLALANLLIGIIPIRLSIQPSPFLQKHSFLFVSVSPCVMA